MVAQQGRGHKCLDVLRGRRPDQISRVGELWLASPLAGSPTAGVLRERRGEKTSKLQVGALKQAGTATRGVPA